MPHYFLIWSWNIWDFLISQIRFFDIRNLNSWSENPLYIPDIKKKFLISKIFFWHQIFLFDIRKWFSDTKKYLAFFISITQFSDIRKYTQLSIQPILMNAPRHIPPISHCGSVSTQSFLPNLFQNLISGSYFFTI